MQEEADADVDAAAAAAASLNISDSSDSQDVGIPYIDRLISTLGGDPQDEDDTDDEFFLPEEDGEDGESSDEDDEMSYDSDESSVHMAAFNRMLYDRFDGLSEEGKEMLTWKLGKNTSFSDWTIEINVEGEGDKGSPQAYHVHRVTLAVGSRKSGYFEGLFASGEFSESVDNTSRIVLPVCAVGCFPDFLDYLYAPPSECNSIISRQNLHGLRYLANYFLAPSLLQASTAFIKRDMRNMETMATYLRMFVGSDDEDAREIIAYAAKVCVEKVASIEEESTSSPLYVMPPAFFLYIMTTLRRDKNLRSADSHEQNHICQLALTYVRYHRESLDANYFSAIASSLYFPDDENLAGRIAIELLEIIKETGWEREGEGLWKACVTALSKYIADGLNGGRPLTLVHVTDITERIPSRAVSALLQYAINVEKRKRTESEPVQVSCHILSNYVPQSTIDLRLLSSDTVAYVKYQVGRHLDWQPTFVKVYFGEMELSDDSICVSGQYSIGDSGLLICSRWEKTRNGEVIEINK